jgi:hypothetical protein
VRRIALFLLPAALAACKVEPTPRHIYNHRDPALVELQESEGEIRTRVVNFVSAFNRGDMTEAVQTMNPAEGLQVMGPTPGDSLSRLGPAGLMAALAELRRPAQGLARTPGLQVSAGQTMGWFAAYVEILPTDTSRTTERLRVSGVFARERGEWRLVQAHLAQGALPMASPPSPDSAAARPEAE